MLHVGVSVTKCVCVCVNNYYYYVEQSLFDWPTALSMAAIDMSIQKSALDSLYSLLGP